MLAAFILPDAITLAEADQVARTNDMYLITDGRRVVVSPIILPGWRQMPVRIKPAAPIDAQVPQCVA
jgi:hypothetical protein